MPTKRRKAQTQITETLVSSPLLLPLAVVGVPALLVRSCTVSFFAEIPMVALWDVKKSRLISLTLEEYVQGWSPPKCRPVSSGGA